MFFDNDDDQDSVASVPENVEDATTHNQPTPDPLGTAIDHLDSARRAEGIIDGYRAVVVLGHKVEDGEGSWAISVMTVATEGVPSDRTVTAEQNRETSFHNRFTADAVFEKLVRRYDLSESRHGMRYDEDEPTEGGHTDDYADSE